MDQLSEGAKRLIRVFKIGGKPWALSYSYRTLRGKNALNEDRAVLNELMRAGLVVFVEKTSKEILYRYTGDEIPENKNHCHA